MARTAQTERATLRGMGNARERPQDNLSEIGALARHWPDRARDRIIAAFLEHKGVGVRAARSLGITYGAMNKIIARLGIGPAIDAACRDAVFPRHTGPKRKPKQTRPVPLQTTDPPSPRDLLWEQRADAARALDEIAGALATTTRDTPALDLRKLRAQFRAATARLADIDLAIRTTDPLATRPTRAKKPRE